MCRLVGARPKKRAFTPHRSAGREPRRRCVRCVSWAPGTTPTFRFPEQVRRERRGVARAGNPCRDSADACLVVWVVITNVGGCSLGVGSRCRRGDRGRWSGRRCARWARSCRRLAFPGAAGEGGVGNAERAAVDRCHAGHGVLVPGRGVERLHWRSPSDGSRSDVELRFGTLGPIEVGGGRRTACRVHAASRSRASARRRRCRAAERSPVSAVWPMA